MTSRRVRRDVLRAAGAGLTAALAGCTDVLGGETTTATDTDDGVDHLAGSAASKWLYDPTASSADQSQLRARLYAPAALAAAGEHVHPEVRDAVVTGRHAGPLPAAETTWSVFAADPLLKGPTLFAAGGSFSEATARETADGFGAEAGDAPSTPTETVAGFDTYRYRDGVYGAVRDGTVAAAGRMEAERFRGLLRSGGGPPIADGVDGAARFVSAAAFGQTTAVSLSRDESATWQGLATGYRIDGASTRVRFVAFRDGRTEGDLRETFERIDGLQSVRTGADGDVRWVEGTAGTDRFAFDGRVANLQELPYEGA